MSRVLSLFQQTREKEKSDAKNLEKCKKGNKKTVPFLCPTQRKKVREGEHEQEREEKEDSLTAVLAAKKRRLLLTTTHDDDDDDTTAR